MKTSATEPTENKEGRKEILEIRISPINVMSPKCFHLFPVGNSNDNISPGGAFLEFKNQYRFLFVQRNPYHFRPYILILSRAPAPST
jgi:hypothetical protein